MQTDIIIVGAGSVGLTLANALSEQTQGELSISVIESSAIQQQPSIVHDTHPVALSASSCHHLCQMGIWSMFQGEATPITTVHLSEQGGLGGVTIHARDHYLVHLGAVVELRRVGQQLLLQLQQRRGVVLYAPAHVVKVTQQLEWIGVTLSDGRQLHGALLVLTAYCNTIEGLLLPTILECNHEDQHSALVVRLGVTNPQPGWAFERLSTLGSLALLPLPQGEYAAVLSLSHLQAERIIQWEECRFLAELQGVFGSHLGRLSLLAARQMYVVKQQMVPRPIAHRMVLVGSAAQTLHPIAAQGFNLAVRDVALLTRLLTVAWHQKEEVGTQQILSSYWNQRQEDRVQTIVRTQQLLRLVGHNAWPWFVLRQVGLFAVTRCLLLQRSVLASMLGY